MKETRFNHRKERCNCPDSKVLLKQRCEYCLNHGEFPRIEADDRTRIEMKGVKLEVKGCKNPVEKLLERNATESTFNEWRTESKDLKNEIENLKKINDEKVKQIKTLKSENRGVRKDVNGCKKIF